jgi:protein transport protein SEC20
VLTARDNLNAAKRAEYLLLVNSAFDPKTRSNTSSPVPGQRRNEKKAALTQEEREVNASRDVTLALRRTHDIMASELSRSQFAHDILNESTLALKELGETYSVLDTMLSSSKNLLGTLLRSQKSDTWYLETAFYVLSVTIAWLLFRRLLYGPLWWLLWFPLRIFFGSLIGVLTGIGLIGGGAADEISSAASSISGTQLVVHNSATRASRPTMAHGGHSITVGGGGKGGPVRPRERPQGQEGETLFEQVGQIIKDSPNDKPSQRVPDGVADRARQAEAQPNPKKRMWEEENEEVKEDRSSKDEL